MNYKRDVYLINAIQILVFKLYRDFPIHLQKK